MIRRFHATHRYSHAVLHAGVLYLSGQVSDSGGSTADQTREVLEKIDRILIDAGSDKSRILQATVWLKDAADFADMNAVWEASMPKGSLPARSTCQAVLMQANYRVEITVVASAI